MYILAIESSCDEFSVSILKNKIILSNVISSQIEDHKNFGGVVPELASRLHVQNFYWVLQKALLESKVNIEQITNIAYTSKPGLIGSLLVGKIVAETLSIYLNVPLLEVNHIHGHIYSGAIDNEFIFPVMCLVVSGGHTQLIYMKDELSFEIIGETQDDAIGECYDKVARQLNFEYPGGPKIDQMATGKDNEFIFPIPKTQNKFDFSFSGFKTYSLNVINKMKMKNEKIDLNNFCASFQSSVIKVVIDKLTISLESYKVKTIALAGGVSANNYLRKKFIELGELKKIKTVIPKKEYCTDNAAMIGRVAYEYIIKEV